MDSNLWEKQRLQELSLYQPSVFEYKEEEDEIQDGKRFYLKPYGHRILGFRFVLEADCREYDLDFLSRFLNEDVISVVASFLKPIPPVIPKDCSFEIVGVTQWNAFEFGGDFQKSKTLDAWHYFPNFPLFRGIGLNAIGNLTRSYCMCMRSIPSNAKIEFVWAFDCAFIRRYLFQEEIFVKIPGKDLFLWTQFGYVSTLDELDMS
jgi:hypothetical protein